MAQGFTNPRGNLPATGVGAGSYGSASAVGTFTVDAFGRLTAASSVTIAINGNQITSGIVGPTFGGTGVSSYAAGDMLYASGTNVLAGFAGNTTATKKFLSMTSSAPSWGTLDASDVSSGVLPIARGGTNVGSVTANGVVVGNSGATAYTSSSNLTYDGTTFTVGALASLTSTQLTIGNGTSNLGRIQLFDGTTTPGYNILLGAAGTPTARLWELTGSASGSDHLLHIKNSSTGKFNVFMDAGRLIVNGTSDDGSNSLQVTGNVTFAANTDNLLVSGYGRFGLATSGTSTAFYIAQASNFTSTAFALEQTSVGNTVLNAASGQSVFIRVNNAGSPSAVTVGSAAITCGTGYPLTVNDKATVVGGSITLSNATSNLITYNTNGVAAPAFTTISAGMKIALYNDVDATHTGLGIGIESNYVWFASSISTNGFKWYQGTTEKMRMAVTTGALLINQTTDDTATKLQVTGGANLDGVRSFKVTRSIDTTTIGNTTNIGSFAQASEGAWIRVRFNGTVTNTVQMKEYWIYSTAWPSQLGWIEIPTHGGRGFNGLGEVTLDARQQTASGTVAIELRLRVTSANPAGAMSLTVYVESAQVFTADSTTGTGATVVAGYLSQPGYQFPCAAGVWNNSSAGMFISSAGRVSIGTTTDDGTNALQVTGSAVVNQVVATSGSPVGMKFVGAAHTTLTAATEAIDVYVNCARTVQFATSTPTTQRAVFIAAPTYSCDTAAQTITTAATLTINAAPAAGTNVTITNPYAFWVQGGVSKFADATVAGSAATGAVVVAGSIGVGNRLWVGSNVITDAAYYQNVATISSTGSITASQGLILVDATSGSVVLTLPAAVTFSSHSQSLTIVRIDASANTVTVQRAGSNTLNGGASGILMPAVIGFTVNLRSDGSTAWYMSSISNASIGGSIASSQVAFGSGANTIQGSATLTYTATTGLALAPSPVASGVQTALLLTGATNTGMTLSTEVPDVDIALNRTIQWAAGNFATQRAFVIRAPTYAFAGGSTINNAATFAITGAPVQGTNASFGKSFALWVQSGKSQFDGPLQTIASTTGTAGINIPAGSAPTSPVNGDIWTTSTGLFAQINGSTVGPFGIGSGTIGGSIASSQIAFGSGSNTIQGSATLTYTATTGMTMAPTAVAATTQTAFTLTGAANTNMTSSTEVIDVNLNLSRIVQWASGSFGTQRAVVVQAPTYAFLGGSTITTAATFAITGAPVQGTNATLTNAYALWVQGGNVLLAGTTSASSAIAGAFVVGNGTAATSVAIGSGKINAGGTLTVGGASVLAASSTTISGLNVPHGTAPTAPVNGDIWTATTGFFAQINGSTISLDRLTVVTHSAGTLTVTGATDFLQCDASSVTTATQAATLPTAVGNTGRVIYIMKIDATTIPTVISGTSAQTFNGDASIRLTEQYQKAMVISDGANWKVFR